MTVRERASLVGINLRAVMHWAIVPRPDRTMRAAIAKLEAVTAVQIEQDRAGRDRALNALAEER